MCPTFPSPPYATRQILHKKYKSQRHTNTIRKPYNTNADVYKKNYKIQFCNNCRERKLISGSRACQQGNPGREKFTLKFVPADADCACTTLYRRHAKLYNYCSPIFSSPVPYQWTKNTSYANGE